MQEKATVVLSPEWTAAPSALQGRMRELQGRVEECRGRLQAQDGHVAGICRDALELQAQAEVLKTRLEEMSRRLQELGVGVASVPAPVEAALPAPAPQPAAQPAQAPAAPEPGSGPRPGRRLLQCIPYLVLTAAGVGYGLTGHASEAPAPAPSSVVVSPAAETTAPPPEAAETRESEALSLVYEYRLPGTEENMLDLIGSREEALGPSPWDIECGEDLRCEVDFMPRGLTDDEPLYEFSVDLGAGTVTPSSETVERLLSSSVAQNDPR